jgi:hypothetical protein
MEKDEENGDVWGLTRAWTRVKRRKARIQATENNPIPEVIRTTFGGGEMWKAFDKSMSTMPARNRTMGTMRRGGNAASTIRKSELSATPHLDHRSKLQSTGIKHCEWVRSPRKLWHAIARAAMQSCKIHYETHTIGNPSRISYL